MAAVPGPLPRQGLLAQLSDRFRGWRAARIADPGFQTWASRFPLTRRLARARADQLYDLVAGFVYSQVLAACVELDLFERLARAPATAEKLSPGLGLEPERAGRLLQAAAALGLLRRLADGRYALADLGAALRGAPGVSEMVRHHRLFYADLADPVALLRGETNPALARFYGYVGGAVTRDMTEAEAAPYSALMAASQAMVAEETIGTGVLTGVNHLLDVGGGEGGFLLAALRALPGLTGTLFDLPAVAERARARFAAAGVGARARALGGSFREDALPSGADAVALVRVLYDHDDAAVRRLLAAARAALPAGGRIIVSEPMSGGARPTRVGDVYFAFYTLAMSTGQTRSPARIGALLAEAGFGRVRTLAVRRSFVTSVVTAQAV
jgi:demethylspheroidene O-methyltransferase